jgi:DMSO/TMAO reductase YedYZ molybdopterin-dependent catalytic subunit
MFSGNRFPVTHSLAADPVDVAAWRLALSGAVAKPAEWTYAELLNLPQTELIATLDCTLGWYTLQAWQGVWLKDLLDMAETASGSFAVRLEAITGYAHILPNAEAEQILLATQVGGETLEHWHGYPLRAVVPSRRGWFWVKWLSRVEVLALDSGRGNP